MAFPTRGPLRAIHMLTFVTCLSHAKVNFLKFRNVDDAKSEHVAKGYQTTLILSTFVSPSNAKLIYLHRVATQAVGLLSQILLTPSTASKSFAYSHGGLLIHSSLIDLPINPFITSTLQSSSSNIPFYPWSFVVFLWLAVPSTKSL